MKGRQCIDIENNSAECEEIFMKKGIPSPSGSLAYCLDICADRNELFVIVVYEK